MPTLAQYTRVPKGRLNPDKSYNWDCNHVNHVYSIHDCPWCCGYDLEKILESLKDSKSQTYYGNLKAFLKLKGKEIYDLAIAINKEEGIFTLTNVLEITDLYQLRRRTKIIIEWLEECRILPAGTYEDLKERGFQPMKIKPSKPDRLEHLRTLITKSIAAGKHE